MTPLVFSKYGIYTAFNSNQFRTVEKNSTTVISNAERNLAIKHGVRFYFVDFQFTS